MTRGDAKTVLAQLKQYIADQASQQDASLLQKLVDFYYVSVSREELFHKKIHTVYQNLLSHFNFMRTRQVGQIKLRVFNPESDQEGFSANRSIIQLTQDDMPFLVDSVLMELHRQGIHVHFIVHNGVVPAERNAHGELIDFKQSAQSSFEANIYLEIDRQHDEASLMFLQDALFAVLSDVGLAVHDFLAMRQKMEEASASAHHSEISAFLKWLIANHFTFLGYVEFKKEGAHSELKRQPETELGLMRDQSTYGVGCFSDDFKDLPIEFQKEPILLLKSNAISTVHRPIYMDAVLLRHFNEKGELVAETRFLGLYTSSAYHAHVMDIPYLREKVAAVFKRANFAPHSHDIKALEDIIESFPKDELFQMTETQLFDMTMEIVYIQERAQIRLFLHRDLLRRFYTGMVYLPRDLFNSELRIKFQNILMRELHGESSSFTPHFLPSLLCRVDFRIRVQKNHSIDSVNTVEIEDKLRQVARNWREDFQDYIISAVGEHQGRLIFNKYARAFPANYCDDFTVAEIYHDISKIEELCASDQNLMIDFERDEVQAKLLHFKAMQRHQGLWLAQVLPILENFGLKVIEERPYEVRLPDNLSIWISDFLIDGADLEAQFDQVKDLFKLAFLEVWHKQAENDGFNRLTLQIGLNAREVVFLRAIGKYLAQIGFVYTQNYIEDTLCQYPELTQCLVSLFILKFDVALRKTEREASKTVLQTFDLLLKKVRSLDHDRILRRFRDVILAMLRTNYFQKDEQGHFKPYVSFKLNCSLIPDLPLPIPMFEVFVYAPEVEGVHLRGAKVARGGIRWSDRRDDFRTEVLGLMKAQQVKNAVIVPLGAKGGFYPKCLPLAEGRDAILVEAKRCYKIFIAALLDITDNIVNNEIVPPQEVLRYDEDDPYLVVAADKGTATFSDLANGIALQYGFWLGDAFASGGTHGYDHKKMGITARGAWESVKRNFLYINKNIQEEDFTVVGIGDMSGDVFGNGMLLSPHILLVAAFNHEHIFLDPSPHLKQSFAERERLFALPRSTWADYNIKLISRGGGIFERDAKTIPISPEVQALLNIVLEELSPNDLIKAILCAPVDLLWNGGIGTYIKASTENNMDVGDRSNDGLRVDANDLHCKVIGEGGNLGVTQLGRVEFALLGGQICTDAIDNSAGVDCSDHEVNIKILLNTVLQANKINLVERNHILAQMQDEVAALVLSDNYHQTQLISNGVAQENAGTTYIRLLRELEREGFLSRSLEYLPGDKILKSRMNQGGNFTKPEFAVLMAYAKTTVKKILLDSTLPEEPCCIRYLQAEFPALLSEKFLETMMHHQLRREIIVTQLTNLMMQYMGIAYIHQMYDEVGASPELSAKAFIIALDIFEIEGLWKEIEALDGKVPAAIQTGMMNEISHFLEHQCRWLVRHYRSHLNVEEVIQKLREPCAELFSLSRLQLNKDQKACRLGIIDTYAKEGVPTHLAHKMADFYYLYSALDIADLSQKQDLPLKEMLKMYYSLSLDLGLSRLRSILKESAKSGYWEMLSASSLKDDLNYFQAELVMSVIQNTSSKQTPSERIQAWSKQYHYFTQRWHILFNDFLLSQQELFRILTLMDCMKDLVEVCRKSA